jgi:hypothetical protein
MNRSNGIRLSKDAWEFKKKTESRKRKPKIVSENAPKTFEGYVKSNLDDLDGEDKIKFLLDSVEFIQEYIRETEGDADQSAVHASAESASDVQGLICDEVSRNPRTVLARFKEKRKEADEDDMTLLFDSGRDELRKFAFNCESCGGYLFHSDHETTCAVCGKVGTIVEERGANSGAIDYDQNTVETRFHYKRINHFDEWLSSFQGRENVDIPGDVIELVRAEFVKARIGPEGITHTRVRAFLKKLNFNKLYEHSYHICRLLGGKTVDVIPRDLEAKLRRMFQQIQAPFELVKPPERHNFLSYSFVLYKFLELLKRDEYLPHLQLLKSTEKLYQQDRIWKDICRILHWEFVSTV